MNRLTVPLAIFLGIVFVGWLFMPRITAWIDHRNESPRARIARLKKEREALNKAIADAEAKLAEDQKELKEVKALNKNL